MLFLSFITLLVLVLLIPSILLTQCCKKKAKNANEDKGTNQALEAGKIAKSKTKLGEKKPVSPIGINEAKKPSKAMQSPTPTSTAAGQSNETAVSKKEKPKSKTDIQSTKTAAVKPKVGVITALPKSGLPKGNDAITAFTLDKSANRKTMTEIGKTNALAVSHANEASKTKTDDGTPTLILPPSPDMMSVAAMTANPEKIEKSKSGDKSKDGQKTSSFYDLDTTNKTSDSLYENVDLPTTKSTAEKSKEDEDSENTEKSIMKNKLADERKQKKLAEPDEYQTLADMSTEKVFKKVG